MRARLDEVAQDPALALVERAVDLAHRFQRRRAKIVERRIVAPEHLLETRLVELLAAEGFRNVLACAPDVATRGAGPIDELIDRGQDQLFLARGRVEPREDGVQRAAWPPAAVVVATEVVVPMVPAPSHHGDERHEADRSEHESEHDDLLLVVGRRPPATRRRKPGCGA